MNFDKLRSGEKRSLRGFATKELRAYAALGITEWLNVLTELSYCSSLAAVRLRRELTSGALPKEANPSTKIENEHETSLRQRWRGLVASRNFVKLESTDEDTKLKEINQSINKIEQEWKRRRSTPAGTSGIWGYSSKEFQSLGQEGLGRIPISEWPTTGMLSLLGYHVGKSKGLEPAERRSLLLAIFESQLPPLNNIEYMNLWGVPSSEKRFERMNLTLKGLASLANNRIGAELAASDWQSDHLYLQRTLGY